jgi:AcrR family transcriptional regulator
MTSSVTPARRRSRVGRPRRIVSTSDLEPREEILSAAAALFEAYGYSGTSTRKIAAAARLQQGSIFHHFERKADILTELLDRCVEPVMGLSRLFEGLEAPAEERLVLLAYCDARNICSGPYNIAALMHLREVRMPEFRQFWDKRQQLRATYQRIIADGIAEGAFIKEEPRVLTDLTFGLVESAIYWFKRGEDDPSDAAGQIAKAVMRVVLDTGSRSAKLLRGGLRHLDGDHRFSELGQLSKLSSQTTVHDRVTIIQPSGE